MHRQISLSHAARTIVEVTIGASMLSVIGLLFGRPTIFNDTIAYLRHGEYFATLLGLAKPIGVSSPGFASMALTPEAFSRFGPLAATVAGARSPFYGLVIFLLSGAGALWIVVATQAVAAAWLLRLTCAFALPDRPTTSYYVTVFALACGSSLPYFVNFLMPDVFAGFEILAVVLFLFFHDRLSRTDRGLIYALVLAAALFHRSHVALLVPLVIVGAALLTRQGVGWTTTLKRSGVLLSILVVQFSATTIYEAAFRRDTGTTLGSPPFLMARLMIDGPGQDYLRSVCPGGASPTLCAHKDQAFHTEDEFLWFPFFFRGLFGSADDATRRRLQREQIPFVLAAVSFDPKLSVLSALSNWGTQLSNFAVMEPLRDPALYKATPLHDVQAVDRLLPGVPPCMDLNGCTRIGGPGNMLTVYLIHVVSIALSALALISLTLRPQRSMRDKADMPALKAAGVTVLSGILANAAICGILSGPFDRYEARLVWLVPMLGMLSGLILLRDVETSEISPSRFALSRTSIARSFDFGEDARRLVRFILIGGTATALYAAISTILAMSWPEHRAMIGLLVYLSLVPPTYLAQKAITYRIRGDTSGGFARYCGVQLCSITIASGLGATVPASRTAGDFVVYIGIAGCCAALNFVLCRLVVFRVGSQGTDEVQLAADRQT